MSPPVTADPQPGAREVTPRYVLVLDGGYGAAPSDPGSATDAIERLDSAHDLQQRLSDDADAHALILYRTPASLLCALADTHAPQAVLDAWRASAEMAAPMLRRARRRISLMDAALVWRDPDQAAAVSGLSSKTLQRIAGPDIAAPAPLLPAAAAAVVRDDVKAQGMLDELEASAIRSPEADEEARTSADLFIAVRDQGAQLAAVERACERARDEERALTAQNKDLEGQISACRDALEAARLKTEQDQARVQSLTQGHQARAQKLTQERDKALAAAKTAVGERDAARADAAAARDAAREAARSQAAAIAVARSEADAAKAATQQVMADSNRRIQTLVTDRAAAAESLAELQAERDDLGTRLERAEAWIHLTRSSFSYRIMQPLRRIHGLFRRPDPIDRSDASE